MDSSAQVFPVSDFCQTGFKYIWWRLESVGLSQKMEIDRKWKSNYSYDLKIEMSVRNCLKVGI